MPIKLRTLLTVIILVAALLSGCSRKSDAQPSLPAPAQPTSLPTQTLALPALPQVTSSPSGSTAIPESFTVNQAEALLPQAQANLTQLDGETLYTLAVQIDFNKHAFQGSAQIDYTNREDVPLKSLYFRLYPNGHKSYGDGVLKVSNVMVEGSPVKTTLSVSSSVLEVELPAPLEVNQKTRVQMDFEGVVPEGFGSPDNPQGYGIYTFSEGVLSLSGWYPLLAVYDQDGWNLDPVSYLGDSVYSDTAFYDVRVTTESDLILASTGSLIAQEVDGNDLKWHFISGPARDFYMVMSPDFEVASQRSGETQVNSYYLPGHASGGEAALSVASTSLDIYNQRFGLYPYKELDVVEAPMENALGVEYPGVFLVASSLYDDPTQNSFMIATAHETAHQWWYNVVGNDVFDAPWLDEALATFSSSIYYEEALGEGAYQGYVGYLQGRLDSLRQDGLDDQVTRSLGYFESLNEPRVYGTVVYTKGALFFVALREEIGDKAFFDALRNYYHDYQFQIADTPDLLDAFENSAGRQLDDFYQEWLYSADNAP
jgi:Peptidase family M1 domain